MWFNRLVIGQEDVDIRASYFADLDAAVMVVNIGDIDAMSQVQFSNITQEYCVIYIVREAGRLNIRTVFMWDFVSLVLQYDLQMPLVKAELLDLTTTASDLATYHTTREEEEEEEEDGSVEGSQQGQLQY